MKKVFYFISICFLFSSNIRIINEDNLKSINQFKYFLENSDVSIKIKDLKLFNVQNFDFEYQYFEAPRIITSTNLTPLSREISLSETAHLLRRTIVGPTIEEINNISVMNIDNAVEYLLRDIEEPSPPGEWVNHPVPNYQNYTSDQIDSLLFVYDIQGTELGYWWIDQIFYNQTSIVEQMTLFWHDHFATSLETVTYPPAMYYQNKTMRENALGNFKDLVTNITFDPAMMVWLDNMENRVGAINENFARELLELFTMGEGNYSQNDVIEAARGLTGYQTDGLNTYFNPSRFDNGQKTFLGQTGNFNAYDIIDIIFEQEQTAYFICEKLYKWFLYENPNEEVVEQLAQIMLQNNYEIKPVLHVLLNSEHFFDENFYGSKFKEPLTHAVGTLRKTYIDINQTLNLEYSMHEILRYVQFLGGQLILYPPDVSGWPGYRNWINTYTLPWRKLYTNYLYDGTFGSIFDPISFAEKIPNGLSDPNALLEYLYIYFHSIEPSEVTKQNLLDELLAGADPFEWHLIFYDGASDRFMNVLQRIMRLSEYQLK